MIDHNKILSVISLIKKVTKSDDVYVFGSYANGTPTDNSDLDIAVIKDDISNEDSESFSIRKTMLDNGYVPLDLLFLERKKFQERKNFFGNVYYEIATKGKKFSV